jgi:hypothetical protein
MGSISFMMLLSGEEKGLLVKRLASPGLGLRVGLAPIIEKRGELRRDCFLQRG